jgi:transcriptional regulator with PAS, ATPase and Fis domain
MSARAHPLKSGRRIPPGYFDQVCAEARLIKHALKPEKPARRKKDTIPHVPGAIARVEFLRRHHAAEFEAIAAALRKKGADRAEIASKLNVTRRTVFAVAVHLKIAPGHGCARRREA